MKIRFRVTTHSKNSEYFEIFENVKLTQYKSEHFDFFSNSD